jgi:nucleotidyltransferase substrate binding protein (TIGR01987 family)
LARDINRLYERLDDFGRAFARLGEVMKLPVDDIVRDAAIQRFEFTYETAWKAMKLYLEFKGLDVRNPQDTLRAALQQGLIDDGNAWSMLHEKRNLTSHTYNEATANEVYEFVKRDGLRLFEYLAVKLSEVAREKST